MPSNLGGINHTTMPIIIPPKPNDPAELAIYNSYLDQIRFNVWSDLSTDDLSDNQIDNVSILGRAERTILKLAGKTSLTNREFEALAEPEKSNLLSGVILQSALYLLHSFPQLKRAQMTELQSEFYQDTTKEEFLEKQIQELFPQAVVSGQAVPSGGDIVTWDSAY